MKKGAAIFSILLLLSSLLQTVAAQCSLCTKTAQQLGEKPAIGLNQGILYLMLAPFAIVAVIAYRWFKGNKEQDEVQ